MKKILITKSQFSILIEGIRNLSDNEIIIDTGTELFHGSVEPFEKERLHAGGYDQVLWTTKDPAMAQTYISVAGKLFTSSDHISMPNDSEYVQNFQKSVGIDYDYSQVEFDRSSRHGVKSYREAPIFQKMVNKYYELSDLRYKKYLEFNALKKELDTKDWSSDENFDADFNKLSELEDEENRISKEMNDIKPSKIKNEYVNNKLIEMGYKPTSIQSQSDSDYGWKLLYDNDTIQPANYRSPGRLFVLKPKRDLKIYDTTSRGKREGDLTDVDYHKHSWFRKAEESGYDGIKITDFAQSIDQGNIGHHSIGLFRNTIKDLSIEEMPAIHRELEPYFQQKTNFWSTPEYDKYKKR